MTGDHGWRGGGRFRVARLGGVLVLRFFSLSTRGGRLQRDMGAFFRKEYREVRPVYAPFAVRIWVESDRWSKRIDVDNVAKACLDALTGVVWNDDSQVVRLTVEKAAAESEAVTIAVEPADEPTGNADLERLLAGIEERDKG